jgi:hypothetical protein
MLNCVLISWCHTCSQKVATCNVLLLLQVCGAVSIEELSGNRLRIIGGPGAVPNFRVGRRDSLKPSPNGTLLPGDATPRAFAAFWQARGFNMEEAIALMGSHALIDEQACMVKSPDQYCDPTVSSCRDVRMFKCVDMRTHAPGWHLWEGLVMYLDICMLPPFVLSCFMGDVPHCCCAPQVGESLVSLVAC